MDEYTSWAQTRLRSYLESVVAEDAALATLTDGSTAEDVKTDLLLASVTANIRSSNSSVNGNAGVSSRNIVAPAPSAINATAPVSVFATPVVDNATARTSADNDDNDSHSLLQSLSTLQRRWAPPNTNGFTHNSAASALAGSPDTPSTATAPTAIAAAAAANVADEIEESLTRYMLASARWAEDARLQQQQDDNAKAAKAAREQKQRLRQQKKQQK